MKFLESPYAKAIIAGIGGAATVLAAALPDQSTGAIIASAVLAALTAAGVYAVPNQPAPTDDDKEQ